METNCKPIILIGLAFLESVEHILYQNYQFTFDNRVEKKQHY